MIKVVLECDECKNYYEARQFKDTYSLDNIALAVALNQGWRQVERDAGTIRSRPVLLCPACAKKEL